jgi:hypothetical protein
MEYIKIKRTEELKRICQFTGWTAERVEDAIFLFMGKYEMIADSSDEWGKTLEEILREESQEPEGVAIMTIRTTNPEILLAFKKLEIIGTGDCTECGGEMEEEHEGNYICTFCGHETRPRTLDGDFNNFIK